jgi:hypothetical protein
MKNKNLLMQDWTTGKMNVQELLKIYKCEENDQHKTVR